MYLAMLQMVQQTSMIPNNVATAQSSTDGSLSVDSACLSSSSGMLSTLWSVQQSDPDSFKSIMSEISSKLLAAADESSEDSIVSGILSEIAEKFSAAAETGDLSSLAAGGPMKAEHRPPPPPRPMAESEVVSAVEQANEDCGGILGDISGMSLSEIFEKLLELKETDEESYETLLASIEEKLLETSEDIQGSGFEAEIFAAVSDNFLSALESGEFTQMQPPPPPPPPPFESRVSAYTSDASTGSQSSLSEIFDGSNSASATVTDSWETAMQEARDILLAALGSSRLATS
jgi:hypothetical protein